MNTTNTIQLAIDEGVSLVFTKLVKEYELPFGDMSPEQVLRLDNIKQDLADLCGDYVHQNLPEQES